MGFLGHKISMLAQLTGNDLCADYSPMFAPSLGRKARLSPLNCKNEYLVLALGEETAVQAVVGCIVWVFRRLKTPSQDERPRLRAP